MTFIEVERAGFLNKGAELMLLATLTALRERCPSAQFVTAALEEDYPQRSALGLWQRPELWRGGLDLAESLKHVPRRLRRRFGLVTRGEVRLALDASGMAYAEQWGSEPTRHLARRAQAWANHGTPFFLLPQAFGPFKGAPMQDAFRRAAETIEHIAARDDISLAHVQACLGPGRPVSKIPDITLGMVPKAQPKRAEAETRRVFIIPNARMIDRQSERQGQAYKSFMLQAMRLAAGAQVETQLFIHEGSADIRLGEALMAEAGVQFPIQIPKHAIDAKQRLSTSDLILGSRYHALLAGLSAGVHTLGLGWSHKYQGLFADFQCTDWLLPYAAHPSAALEQFAEALITPLDWARQKALQEVGDHMRAALCVYWDRVFDRVRGQPGTLS
jgi:colanic acid/amylovoran biosynthesis protein